MALFVAFVSLATNLVSNATFDGVTPQVFVREHVRRYREHHLYAYHVSGFHAGWNDARKWAEFSALDLQRCICDRICIEGAKSGRDGSKPWRVGGSRSSRTCATLLTTCTGETDLVSTPDGVTPANGASTQTATSGSSGRFIAFTSTGTNLGFNSSGVQEIYIRDTCLSTFTAGCTPSTILASTRDGTTPANSLAETPSFDTTGQFIAFASAASNLGANTANGI